MANNKPTELVVGDDGVVRKKRGARVYDSVYTEVTSLRLTSVQRERLTEMIREYSQRTGSSRARAADVIREALFGDQVGVRNVPGRYDCAGEHEPSSMDGSSSTQEAQGW